MNSCLDISDSIRSLTWENESKSFDNTDIRYTRPGFGVIVLLNPDDTMQTFRQLCEKKCLMRTRDDFLHMTVCQFFLNFNLDYDFTSLPNNLLEVIHNFIEKSTKKDIENLNEYLESLIVGPAETIHLFGRDYPSHLVVEIKCKEVCTALQNFKESINRIAYEWLVQFAKELEKRTFKSEIMKTEMGYRLSSNGWDLFIGYTSNPDYKTHVTLGILRTTDPKLNRALLEAHDNVSRYISPKFLSEEGHEEKVIQSKSWKDIVTSYRMRELKKLKDYDMSEYPTLKTQVNNAHAGLNVQVTKQLIDEWAQIKLKELCEKEPLDCKNACFKISNIHMSVLNMARMQTFEKMET